MKKILLVALTLLVTGTMYADKKCCKDKASCSKTASAKSCSHDEAGGKACCKKGTASVGTDAKEEMPACCKKSIAAGGKACCAKGARVEAAAKEHNATPSTDKKD